MQGKPMPAEHAIEILKIACRSFTDLTDDKNFDADIAAAITMAHDVQKTRERALPEFGGFIDEFVRAEKNVLLQAGVDMTTTEDILKSISDLSKELSIENAHLQRLSEKIKFCQKLSCRGHDQIKLMDATRPIWQDVLLATRGVALIGIDVGGVAAAAGTFSAPGAAAAAAVLGTSVDYGARAVWKAIKGHW